MPRQDIKWSDAHSFGGSLMFLTRMLQGDDLNANQKFDLLSNIREAAEKFRDGETTLACQMMQIMASASLGTVAMKTKEAVTKAFG